MHAAQCRDGWFSVDTAEWIADRGEYDEELTDDLREWLEANGYRYPHTDGVLLWAKAAPVRTPPACTGTVRAGTSHLHRRQPRVPSAPHKRHMVERCRLSLPTWASAHVPSSRANGLRARRPRARPRQSARYTRMSADGEFEFRWTSGASAPPLLVLPGCDLGRHAEHAAVPCLEPAEPIPSHCDELCESPVTDRASTTPADPRARCGGQRRNALLLRSGCHRSRCGLVAVSSGVWKGRLR